MMLAFPATFSEILWGRCEVVSCISDLIAVYGSRA